MGIVDRRLGVEAFDVEDDRSRGDVLPALHTDGNGRLHPAE
jgi:hypothetical protein